MDEWSHMCCANYTHVCNLTKEEPPIRSETIEELKSKLEHRDLLSHCPDDNPEKREMIPEGVRTGGGGAHVVTDEGGLIVPRKPANPVREDPGRQNLHKELLFNQKIGKNVLSQKTELQRAMEKQKDNMAKKQLENRLASNKPELEKVIADRARKIENPDQQDKNEDDKVINPEFIQARMKLKNRQDFK
ncbi:protein FAM107B isoform X2 [Aethina tumida]|uniref:protein FAM107B isoform X2 n=1 Tax=Aethina tumida TaxID=116153 RepID=UPI002147A49A|nr:protein FAM107B isoform X2 [Aethina tumida]